MQKCIIIISFRYYYYYYYSYYIFERNIYTDIGHIKFVGYNHKVLQRSHVCHCDLRTVFNSQFACTLSHVSVGLPKVYMPSTSGLSVRCMTFGPSQNAPPPKMSDVEMVKSI
jgi:hypothetical protein